MRIFEGRVCRGGHEHVRLEGSLTTYAAAYPLGLCREWADVIFAFCRGTNNDDFTSEASKCRPGALEDLYYNEILEAAPWEVIMKQPCGLTATGRRPHINVSEVRGCLKTIRARNLRGFNTRQVYGLDSQVGIGVLSKGRSPSHVLNDELRSGLPAIVSYRHYPGFKFSPTRLNRADDPTRDREVPKPRGCADFIAEFAKGHVQEWDARARLPRQRRADAPWAHFVVRLLRPTALVPWSDLFQ